MTALCSRCELPLAQSPAIDCSAAAVHRAAALELGRVGLAVAELRAHAQRVVDAYYPGSEPGEDVGGCIAALSGYLLDTCPSRRP